MADCFIVGFAISYIELTLNKDMFTFNGSIVGNWTVVKRTNTQIVMQAFLPYENNLVLTKK